MTIEIRVSRIRKGEFIDFYRWRMRRKGRAWTGQCMKPFVERTEANNSAANMADMLKHGAAKVDLRLAEPQARGAPKTTRDERRRINRLWLTKHDVSLARMAADYGVCVVKGVA